jgi:Flp pilus assembly protein TadG
MRSPAKSFWRNESGAIAAIYALALPVLIAAGGIAFDYARLAAMDSELQNAADQAALAAATQLDQQIGSCSRASAAAVSLVTNNTVFANEVGGVRAVVITDEPTCDATGKIKFWQNKEKTSAATGVANARFVEVTVNARTARYALTPIVGAISSGAIDATAFAGLGSSVCKVPPIMLCSPDPTTPFNADGRRGQGVVATGHSPGSGGNKNNGQEGDPGDATNSTWSPGNFGFLQVNDPDANNRNAALLKALAYVSPPIDCVQIDENKVSTGNPQGLYDAINTRFGIYDFNNNGGGNVLASCEGTGTGGNCPPAPNVRMDYVKSGNSCKINRSNGNGGNGFKLPPSGSEFKPVNPGGDYDAETAYHSNTNAVAAMGLPRDNCHYTSFNGSGFCAGGTGRFGNGEWARQDYFTKYHSANKPSGWDTFTRYETYLWELAGNMPSGGAPTCGGPAGNASRRVLTVAVVSNCASLSGASQPVTIDEWVDVFLVEPSSDDSLRWNAFKDAIYMEIIGKSTVAGSGVYSNQSVRRDAPYLIE